MKRTGLFFLLVLAAVITVIIIIVTGTVSSAAEETKSGRVCAYESIEIRHNDSLWSIAEKYAPAYGVSTAEYVRELKEVNGLNGDRIIAGKRLIVVFWEEK